MKRLALLAVIILAFFLIPESSAFAQTIQLVVCEGDQCNACNLVKLANNVIRFLIVLSILLATIMFIWAGFLFVTSGGNQTQLQKGKKMFMDVLIGIIIVLTGFLIVDTVMKTLAGNSLMGGGPWNQIECVPNPSAISTGVWDPSQGGSVSVSPGTGGSTSGISVSGPTMTAAEARAALTERGIAVNSGVNLEGVNASMIDQIIATGNETGRPLTITSARDGSHENGCHAAGTCLDVVCTSCGSNASAIQGFISAAESRGYCAVYEPGQTATCPAGVSPCRAGVGTGAHYSFYMSAGSKDAKCQ